MEKCKIEYIIDKQSYNTIEEIENVINNITEPKTIKITYKVSYKPNDETITKNTSKTIIIK